MAIPRREVSPAPFIGMAGLAVDFFLYAASATVAPWWSLLVLMPVYGFFLLVGLAWWTPHPSRVPWVAVVGAVVWFVGVLALAGV